MYFFLANMRQSFAMPLLLPGIVVHKNFLQTSVLGTAPYRRNKIKSIKVGPKGGEDAMLDDLSSPVDVCAAGAMRRDKRATESLDCVQLL